MAKYHITRGHIGYDIHGAFHGAPIQGFHSFSSSCGQDTSRLWTWNLVRSRGSCLQRAAGGQQEAGSAGSISGCTVDGCEMLHQLIGGKHPIIYRVSTIQGGAGVRNHPPYDLF